VAPLVDVQFRPARPSDADAVAALHADSWRRHYRGAYSDAFLDGDVYAERLVVWSSRLLGFSAQAAVARRTGMYLWVLEQNADARAFYEARGGTCVERALVPPPSGDASRLNGSPFGLRYAWSDPAVALAPV